MSDFELLQQYVADRAGPAGQDAFAELVRRHVDHVYAAALRQTARDSDAAEEVTQRVFILLAAKAATLAGGDPQALIGGWLFNAVRYIALDVLRKEARRARHEQKAAEMAQHSRGSSRHAAGSTGGRAGTVQPHDPDWHDVEAELDDAMSHLAEPARGVLVLRFFEGKTSREVGEHLGISEEAARKRVSRAVDELRELFMRRGIVMSASGLAEGLVAIAVTKAPAGLAASAASAATSAAAAAVTTSTSTAATVTGGLLMASAKAKTAALVAAVVLLTGGAVTVGPKFFSPTRARTVTLAQSGPSITGTVFGPDGKPVAGAEVRVAAGDKRVSAYTANARDRADGLTDASGKYAVPKPQDDHYVIVVSAPQGYAQVSWKQLARGEQARLEPWGRIEGIAYADGKPQPKASIHLWRVGENGEPVSHQTSVTADASGHYVLARVAPGGTQLYRMIAPGTFRSTDWTYVEVQAGKTHTVPIGNRGGGSVVGRIDIPPDLAQLVVWKETGARMYEANVRLEVSGKPPKHEKDEAPEEYRAIEEAFGRTPEGRLHKEWMFGRNFKVKPDGTFRIDDLPRGKYTINVRSFEEQAEVNFLEDVARTEFKFEIPAPSSTQPVSAQPIDIGTAVPQRLSRTRPGEPAPDFTVKTLDGGTFRLADTKGKVLVLVCWGAYDNRSEMQGFTDLARKYANDPRVAILGCVSTDSDDEARQYVKKFNLTFAHTSDSELMNKFDNSWPSAVIVGRDGKILQKHLSDDTLRKYMAIALGEQPPATKPTKRR